MGCAHALHDGRSPRRVRSRLDLRPEKGQTSIIRSIEHTLRCGAYTRTSWPQRKEPGMTVTDFVQMKQSKRERVRVSRGRVLGSVALAADARGT